MALGTAPGNASRHWIEATVAEREFLGEFVRYRVRTGDVEVVADQPHVLGDAGFAPGARVHLGIDPGQLRLDSGVIRRFTASPAGLRRCPPAPRHRIEPHHWALAGPARSSTVPPNEKRQENAMTALDPTARELPEKAEFVAIVTQGAGRPASGRQLVRLCAADRHRRRAHCLSCGPLRTHRGKPEA
ncbi:MAG: TOBE domain-containing protein [Burkholderiaceae bacterium]|nr:TOBE domain-containing protein [Burkholderiaceae bacterium]